MAKDIIHLDKRLIKASQERLNLRGIDLETYLGMHLRSMLRAKSHIGLSDTMPFGKYIGEKVEDVVRAEPGYMDWLIINSHGKTQFLPEVITLLDEVNNPDREEAL